MPNIDCKIQRGVSHAKTSIDECTIPESTNESLVKANLYRALPPPSGIACRSAGRSKPQHPSCITRYPPLRYRALGRSGPNLKPGTVCVCGMSGLRKGMNTAQHSPSPGSRPGTDLPSHVQAVSRAVSYVHTHRPRFQVRGPNLPNLLPRVVFRFLFSLSAGRR